MIYGLSVVGVLLVATLVGLIIVMLAASRMHDNLEDIDDDECDDDPEPAAPIEYVKDMPPFPILHLGSSGQHDRYPISNGLRRMWIAHLEASWHLPDREPGATR